MNLDQEKLAVYPRELRVQTPEGEAVYGLLEDRHIVHGGKPPQGGSSVEVSFQKRGIKVVDGPWPDDAVPERTTACYRLLPEGPLAVPTGLLFVRMPDGRPLESGRDDFENLGYRICEVLSFAQHAGWITHLSGDVAFSLAGIEKLAEVPGVQRVEPQMLIQGQEPA